MVHTVNMPEELPRGRRPRKVGLAVAALSFVLAGAAALLFQAPRFVKNTIVARAKAAGFIVDPGSIEMSLSSIHLRDTHVALTGVAGLSATIESIVLTQTGMKTTRIQLDSVHIAATGSPLDLGKALSRWQTEHNVNYELPLPEVTRARLAWRSDARAADFVEISDFRYKPQYAKEVGEQAFALTGSQARVGSYVMQPFVVAGQVSKESAELGLGAESMADASVQVSWRSLPDGDSYGIAFRPVPAQVAAARVGLSQVAAQLAGVQLGGSFSVRLPSNPSEAYTGQLKLVLENWVPPHPPELDGFNFGHLTEFHTTFSVERTLTRVTLDAVTMESGSLKLSGAGSITITDLAYATAGLDLRGSIPCAMLASAMAGSQLGQAYGRWVAQHAGQLIQGQVDLAIHAEVDSRFPERAQIAKQVGTGCGIRPLTIREALALGLPPPPDVDLLRHVVRQLPKVEMKLPALPPVPTIQLPTLGRK